MDTTESRQESYGWYAIEVFVRPLENGTFAAHGCIRHAIKNPRVQEDLPYEYPFSTHEGEYQTADAALTSGMDFAKKKIDALRPNLMNKLTELRLALLKKINSDPDQSGMERVELQDVENRIAILTREEERRRLLTTA